MSFLYPFRALLEKIGSILLIFMRGVLQVHCKRELAIFPSPAGMSLTKHSLGGKKLNYSRPGRVCVGVAWGVINRAIRNNLSSAVCGGGGRNSVSLRNFFRLWIENEALREKIYLKGFSGQKLRRASLLYSTGCLAESIFGEQLFIY